ncbi:MAG: hypothetical protein ACOYNC_14670 [Bacteroidales bacterium]
MVPVIIASLTRKVFKQFEQRGALSPDRAITLEEIGPSRQFIIRRLISHGVIVETSSGKFYLNQENRAAYNSLRRKKAIIALGVMLLAMAVYLLLGQR